MSIKPRGKAYLIDVKVGQERARITGRTYESLMIHNDQYMTTDFDIVVTSIANAFYETNDDGVFFWSPPDTASELFNKIGIRNQHDAFHKLYVAKATNLSSNITNNVNCTRKRCSDENCNFIPNYPILIFDGNTGNPLQPWTEIENIEGILTRQ